MFSDPMDPLLDAVEGLLLSEPGEWSFRDEVYSHPAGASVTVGRRRGWLGDFRGPYTVVQVNGFPVSPAAGRRLFKSLMRGLSLAIRSTAVDRMLLRD